MNWYLKVLKQYADFNGRARRKEFWMFTLFSSLISWVIQLISSLMGVESFLYIGYAYSLAIFIPSLAVAARRLHDVNKSEWFLLLYLLPIIGWIWLIILFCKDGDEGSNQFGSDPKNPIDELNDIGTAQV